MNFYRVLRDRMKKAKFIVWAVLLPLALTACRGQISEKPPVHPNMNMDQQRRFEAQEKNPFFEDGRSMRQPVEGTIARGDLRQNPQYYRGIHEDSSFVTDIPVEVTKSFLYRGQEQYNIYCAPCHGMTGDGNGIIMAGGYGYVPAPSYHQERIRNLSDGELYSAIANGIRTMPSYAHQVEVRDRWAIVAYIRALQRSQNVTEEEIQQYNVDLAAIEQEFQEQQAAEQAKQEAAAAADQGAEVSVARGQEVAVVCMACHSTDGSRMVGPSWQNLYGHEVQLESGETVVADEEYLRESIVNPGAKVVEGFVPSMVSYDYMSESEINSLIAYIKSLSDKSESEVEQ